MTLYIVGLNESIPKNAVSINTTSRSPDIWARGLSPFYLGPCKLYFDYTAKNVENTWQYSKVYKNMVGEDGNPNQMYFAWAKAGWSDPKAQRYPMGKGAIPEYSWWDGEKLTYIQARKKIYVPVYAEAVKTTEVFAKLKAIYEETENSGMDLYLKDYDSFHMKQLDMSYEDCLNCETRKFGHSFVLGMLLEGVII